MYHLAVVLCSSAGLTEVMVVQRPDLYEIQYSGSLAASRQSPRRLKYFLINLSEFNLSSCIVS